MPPTCHCCCSLDTVFIDSITHQSPTPASWPPSSTEYNYYTQTGWRIIGLYSLVGICYLYMNHDHHQYHTGLHLQCHVYQCLHYLLSMVIWGWKGAMRLQLQSCQSLVIVISINIYIFSTIFTIKYAILVVWLFFFNIRIYHRLT